MADFSPFNKYEKNGEDSIVDSNKITEGTSAAEEQTEPAEEVKTTLSIHPDWEMTEEQEQSLEMLGSFLPNLKAGQLSLSGIEIEEDEETGDWQVEAFFRSSLPKEIKLGKMELLVLDDKGQPIAAQVFDMSELGTLPPRSDRPWVFRFDKANIRADKAPEEGWKLTFNLRSLMPHRLDFDETWKDALTDEQKKVLVKAVSTLPALKPGEVNVTGFQIRPLENGNLAVSLLIRNGRKRNLVIEKIPLEVLDAQRRRVAAGSFNLNKLTVKANTTKPWNFIFPKQMVLVDDPDFSKWTVRVVQPKKPDQQPPVQ
ncbi:accessory Sec system S-layer assembly protein [Planococcus lenghuensis]|uniref:Accessory Sec system S-layer assembly protein n=1 Tax=Planococcus lenghuensis TaxID=2213202 RepID=A0A1Q2L1N7_9BACL|nr:accessory Sec system S-layer assembly protein [Planococcus lenghuensis]AQQ53957.1 accessory Sec system S-layer assembly protein [Planococcus lenghuensis]